MFHRPARTHRLATLAVVSVALFMVVGFADVQSFWRWDGWLSANGRWMVLLTDGCATYNSKSGGAMLPAQHPQKGHLHAKVNPDSSALETGFWGFIAHSQAAHTRAGNVKVFLLRLPIWPLLLLLLIIPSWWLFARPARSAFPVVTDAGTKNGGDPAAHVSKRSSYLLRFPKNFRARNYVLLFDFDRRRGAAS